MNLRKGKKGFEKKLYRWKWLIFVIAITVGLFLFTYAALHNIDEKNRIRFQSENYQRISENLSEFYSVVHEIDLMDDFIRSTHRMLPWIFSADAEQISQMLAQEKQYIAKSESLFQHGSEESQFLSLLTCMTIGNQDINSIGLYNQNKQIGIVSASDGGFSSLCLAEGDFCAFLGLKSDFLNEDEYSLIAADPTEYAGSHLYIQKWIADDIVLVCGIEDSIVSSTLLKHNAGRSYNVEEIIGILPDGINLSENNGTLEINTNTDLQIKGEKHIVEQKNKTIMHFQSEEPDYGLYVVLSETGATDSSSSNWFYLLIFVYIVWFGILVFLLLHIWLKIYKPLKSISSQLNGCKEDDDTFTEISVAITRYNQQLEEDKKMIETQKAQLRRIFFSRMAEGKYIPLTEEQIEKIGITVMLEKFVLFIICPVDGRWTNDNSAKGEEFNRQAIVWDARDKIVEIGMLDHIELVMSMGKLIVVAQIEKEDDENYLESLLNQWIEVNSRKLEKKLLLGKSRICSGRESFRGAYQDAICTVNAVELQESETSEEICLASILTKNQEMTDLINAGHYRDAYLKFERHIEYLYQQKSRQLRVQQLQSFLSVVLCMLEENAKDNMLILNTYVSDKESLFSLEKKDDLLLIWQKLFEDLEVEKKKKQCSGYSEQFAVIYQYMEENYRNSELSLTMLADKYNMSTSALSREFQKNTGKGFLECLHYMRIKAAKYEIQHTELSLNEIALKVGYTNALTMSRAFKKYLNCTPGTIRTK